MTHGIYKTTYGTLAYYPGSGNQAFDTTYKQETHVLFIVPNRLRAARYCEKPQYLSDSGRDYITVRNTFRRRQK